MSAKAYSRNKAASAEKRIRITIPVREISMPAPSKAIDIPRHNAAAPRLKNNFLPKGIAHVIRLEFSTHCSANAPISPESALRPPSILEKRYAASASA